VKFPLRNLKPAKGAFRRLLRVSNASSICNGEHDPIYQPLDEQDYALSYAAALLFYADAPACYLMIRGLCAAAKFPATDEELEAEDSEAENGPIELVSFSLDDFKELQGMNTAIKGSEERLNAASVHMTWPTVWYYVDHILKVAERLSELGIRPQLTHSGTFRAAVRLND